MGFSRKGSQGGRLLGLDDMRLDPSTTIAGRPALEIRRLLRRTRCNILDARTVCEELGVSPGEADVVVCELERAALVVKRVSTGIDNKRRHFWENTIKGNAFAMATTARPVKRRTADRVLSQFLDRVATVNARTDFAFSVKRVVVFGSYLTQAEKLNDVDLLVDLIPRNSNQEKQQALERSIRAQACKRGRHWGNMVDQLIWPLTEVQLFLKNRSRTLSLHYSDHALMAKTEHKVIFED